MSPITIITLLVLPIRIYNIYHILHEQVRRCSHIGALLFKIEAAVRARFTTRACTEEACKWNNYFMQKIEPCTVAGINSFSEQATEKKRRKYPNAVLQHHSNSLSDEKKMDLLTKMTKQTRCQLFCIRLNQLMML